MLISKSAKFLSIFAQKARIFANFLPLFTHFYQFLTHFFLPILPKFHKLTLPPAFFAQKQTSPPKIPPKKPQFHLIFDNFNQQFSPAIATIASSRSFSDGSLRILLKLIFIDLLLFIIELP